ncbi:CPBP family intramembrane metalloprotease [Robertkochia marina]|uniref:CPBP family intramembrane metalloprotease n=1 Tax=Robertkochia marina TaxID=1227945 RepID=A0A4S3M2A2_9FLAO|nr:CPBP family intramembrane glutamic endopeptidase [Robertkochia marina]THD68795.1 CPBP family intramembrane metalloprotease [Robertkochia marina]TRZ43869.1 CPBP family intramembrane metalloprotease [Robertkochia marina]
MEMSVNLILLLLFSATLLLGKRLGFGWDVLGLKPETLRSMDFLIGFVASAVAGVLCFGILIWQTEARVITNSYSSFQFFTAAWWTLRSVLIEELLFRGVLLLLIARHLGVHKACIISAVTFGFYHWGSYGVFGDIPRMLEVFVLTGVGGLMFAYAFLLTRSFYLPVGLHLGWNLVSVVVFSEGPLGMQWLEVAPQQDLGLFMTVVIFLYQIIVLPWVTWYYLKQRKGLLW